jgi:hypothetical protein
MRCGLPKKNKSQIKLNEIAIKLNKTTIKLSGTNQNAIIK